MKSNNRTTILHTDLYALTAEELSKGRSNIEVVTAMLKAGIRLVQYREKEKSQKAKLAECMEIRRLTKEAGARFIVNDDVAIAIIVGADGVHVGQDDLPVPEIRKLVGPNMAIGLSTHSPEQARAAVEAGADYIGVGPIFATRTKKDVCEPVGFDYLDHVVRNIDLPFVAIGGIKAHNIEEVARHGASCIAMVSEIVGADDIEGSILNLREKMASA